MIAVDNTGTDSVLKFNGRSNKTCLTLFDWHILRLTLMCETLYLELLHDVRSGMDLVSAAALLVGHQYLCQGEAAVN